MDDVDDTGMEDGASLRVRGVAFVGVPDLVQPVIAVDGLSRLMFYG